MASPQNETRRAWGAAELLELSCGEADTQDLKPNRAALQARNRMRRQRHERHLWRLGEQPLFYFLAEVEAGAEIATHLERYAEIDPNFVRSLGGDRFAPKVHAIEWGGR
jgi:hypothetical protein